MCQIYVTSDYYDGSYVIFYQRLFRMLIYHTKGNIVLYELLYSMLWKKRKYHI